MGFAEAVRTVISKYAVFQGRASRPEFWWWFLAYVLAYIAARGVGGALGMGGALGFLVMLAAFIPNIAVSVRRFHDIGKSGWWVLIFIIPIVGLIAMVYFFAQPSDGPNRFGGGPGSPATDEAVSL